MLAARLAATTRTATPITLYYAGAGLGIALSGAAIPLLLQGHPDRWPLAWVGLALAAALATAASWGAACGDRDQVARPTGRRRLRLLWPVTVAYVLFATGYLAYLTFLSVYLVDHHATATQVALTWSLLGAAVVAAPSLWSRPITAWPGTWALAALLLGLGSAPGPGLGGRLRRDPDERPRRRHRAGPHPHRTRRLDPDPGGADRPVRRRPSRRSLGRRRARRTDQLRRRAGMDRCTVRRRRLARHRPATHLTTVGTLGCRQSARPRHTT